VDRRAVVVRAALRGAVTGRKSRWRPAAASSSRTPGDRGSLRGLGRGTACGRGSCGLVALGGMWPPRAASQYRTVVTVSW